MRPHYRAGRLIEVLTGGGEPGLLFINRGYLFRRIGTPQRGFVNAQALLAGGAGKKSGKKAAKNQGYNPATLVFTRVGFGQQARRIGWHVRPVDFSDAAQVSGSDTKNSVV